MNFSRMTNDELKAYLDENGVDHSEAKVKADYVALAEKVNVEQTEGAETEEPTSLAEKVKSAIKIERTETKKADTDLSYLTGRDYSQLTVGERALIREQSPEYVDTTAGVKVRVTDRLVTRRRIVKLADKSYAKLIKGAEYTLSQADFDTLENEQVKVKTEATKNKCCGQAKYESVNLLEVL
nr:MAG TPA: dimeris T4 recombination endonuclease VII [Caudoviricetes sp.]